MRISIITVSYNSVKTIGDTIESVLSQNYSDIEYIIIDGSSFDGTCELIKKYGSRISTFISEPDTGMYDAMNKGIRLAKGDVIGILNSDDFFCSNQVIQDIADQLKYENIDAVYGDVRFVDPGNIRKTVRYYSSKNFTPGKFKFGFMPSHPSFYVKKKFYNQFGLYKTHYRIAADFELLMRFLLVNKLRTKYLDESFVTMRKGGVSNKSLLSNFILNKEILQACRENGIKTNIFNIYSKYFRKVFEFLK
jgi:glycosyltransferase involved in cell wall biosynthesis